MTEFTLLWWVGTSAIPSRTGDLIYDDQKRPLRPKRQRQVPPQFSWIDQPNNG